MIDKKVYKDFIKNSICSYKERLNLNVREKISIVQKALNFIHNNGTYFFDVSTNVQFLARDLNKQVTIFTHSLDNFNILSEKNDVEVQAIGGCLNKRNRFFYKMDSVNYLSGIRFDAAILGAASITEDGIYYADEEDALIKQTAIKKSNLVIILAEYEKFKLLSYYKGVNWNQIDVIITNKMPPSAFADIIESNDIKLIVSN